MRISFYDFGKMIVDGETHTSDVIIHPARIEASWWRKEGHCLRVEDLERVWDSKPDTLVVGTGFHGNMMVPEETLAHVRARGVDIRTAPSREAVALFNELQADPEHQVVGAFHLTC